MSSNRPSAGFTPGRWVTWDSRATWTWPLPSAPRYSRTANCTFQAGAGIVADSDPESGVAGDLQ